jgi:hypothetical protein
MPRKYDDDDDDRPQPRRRSLDDLDDDDDRRRRRRPRPVAAPSNAGLIAVVGTVVFFIVAGVVGGGVFLFLRAERKRDRVVAQVEADFAREEARHKAELARADDDVRAAANGGAIPLAAVQFAGAYDNDPDQADRLYKNKVLEISGTIDEVQVDEQADTYTVVLQGGLNDSVECEFAKTPENRARLMKLLAGANVTIRGKCLGDTATIEACVVVE